MSGIFSNGSTIYSSVLALDRTFDVIEWGKYFKKTTASTLNLTISEIDSHYVAASDSVIVIVRSKHKSGTTSYNIINLYRFKMSDGTQEWAIQFKDYNGGSFADFKTVIHPRYNELVMFYTTTSYEYYHVQTMNLDDGSMQENVQIEIFKHYSL